MGEKTLTVEELVEIGKTRHAEAYAVLGFAEAEKAAALAIKNAAEAPLLAEVERHRKEAMCANEHRVAQEDLRRQAEADLKAAQEERNTLAQAIGELVVGAGIANNVPMTGPELLLMLEGVLPALTAAQEESTRLRSALEKIKRDDTGEWYEARANKYHLCAKCQDKEYEASQALAPPAGEPVEEVEG